MQENALNGNTALLENVACALVPASFVREWKLWILRPGHHPRPACLDNSPFLCDHGLLALDLNRGDLDRSVCLVRRSDWEVLKELYVMACMIRLRYLSTPKQLRCVSTYYGRKSTYRQRGYPKFEIYP
jgi:hypothetical protein